MTQPTYFGAPPAPRKRSKTPLVLGIVFAIFGLCLLGSALAIGANENGPATTPTVSVSTIAAKGIKAAPPAEKIWTAGQYEVGPDIAPGTYVTTANGPCYWARVSSFDGDLDSIIANHLLSNGAKAQMTVKKTDEGVEFTGRCIWTRK